jgi:hypothetical protein
VFFISRLDLPQIVFMAPGTEKKSSWLDDLAELIRKKNEENQALRKVQESLESIDKSINIGEESRKVAKDIAPGVHQEQQFNIETK